jgi:hypothetical protein
MHFLVMSSVRAAGGSAAEIDQITQLIKIEVQKQFVEMAEFKHDQALKEHYESSLIQLINSSPGVKIGTGSFSRRIKAGMMAHFNMSASHGKFLSSCPL